VFGPDCPNLLVRGEFTALGRSFRRSNWFPLVGRERNRNGFIATGKLKDNAGDVVLSVGWEAARRLKGLIQKFGHPDNILSTCSG